MFLPWTPCPLLGAGVCPFESIGKALPPVYEKPYAELKAAWREHRKKAFYQSAEAVSAFINARVSDEAQVEDISLLDRVRPFPANPWGFLKTPI